MAGISRSQSAVASPARIRLSRGVVAGMRLRKQARHARARRFLTRGIASSNIVNNNRDHAQGAEVAGASAREAWVRAGAAPVPPRETGA